jgi:hypothetical protein
MMRKFRKCIMMSKTNFTPKNGYNGTIVRVIFTTIKRHIEKNMLIILLKVWDSLKSENHTNKNPLKTEAEELWHWII